MVVPTFNEAANVAPLVTRLDAVLAALGLRAEVLFVDDSTDATPASVRSVAATARVAVRLLHREHPAGGLAGAVVEGLRHAGGDVVVVMDGDLQHPPETLPLVLGALDGDVDLVVASRYVPGGDPGGLAGARRHRVSALSTLAARALFPHRLARVSDPMTGFFAVRRDALDLAVLRPRGFKILLEVLATTELRVVEVPLAFAPRSAGRSKASPGRGLDYAHQLLRLRLRTWPPARTGTPAVVGVRGGTR